MVAEIFLKAGSNKKASQVFYNLCKVYNRWKVKCGDYPQVEEKKPSHHWMLVK